MIATELLVAILAPEQFDAALLAGPRADIYSLGVVLYEMVSGERPKMGPGPTQARFKLDSLPERVRDVVARACADAPADRHASAARLREALAAARLGL